ncbi:hypothetical protein PTKIN_Ptkin17bG0049800 [Pterospermum kingtungense]
MSTPLLLMSYATAASSAAYGSSSPFREILEATTGALLFVMMHYINSLLYHSSITGSACSYGTLYWVNLICSSEIDANIAANEYGYSSNFFCFADSFELFHQSNHFTTFSNDSFKKNRRLCGPPLSRKCYDVVVPDSHPREDVDSSLDSISDNFKRKGKRNRRSIRIYVSN